MGKLSFQPGRRGRGQKNNAGQVNAKNHYKSCQRSSGAHGSTTAAPKHTKTGMNEEEGKSRLAQEHGEDGKREGDAERC